MAEQDKETELVDLICEVNAQLAAEEAEELMECPEAVAPLPEVVLNAAEEEELYLRCVYLVVMERKGSISHLQRRFCMGYGRASRYVDRMEEQGIISPMTGPCRAREVLVGSVRIEGEE